MPIRIVPLDARDEFGAGRLARIIDWLEEAADDTVPLLDADRIDVAVMPGRLIPGWSIAAYTRGPASIRVVIDPDWHLARGRPLSDQLRAALAHEVHHAMRWRGPGYGMTLGEALVSEGLAQCQEEEVGCPTPNYATAVDGARLERLAALAAVEIGSMGYDHPEWFYGRRGEADFPWGGGYSLGYRIVRPWLKEAGITASAAVHVGAHEILRPWLARRAVNA